MEPKLEDSYLPPHAAQVITLFGFPYGADLSGGELWFRTWEDGEIKLYANCNDLFYWGTADCEEITEDDLPLLLECFTTLKAVGLTGYLSEYFCARKRNMRPQRPLLKQSSKELLRLYFKLPRRDRRSEG